jgi:hypothetical protein
MESVKVKLANIVKINCQWNSSAGFIKSKSTGVDSLPHIELSARARVEQDQDHLHQILPH